MPEGFPQLASELMRATTPVLWAKKNPEGEQTEWTWGFQNHCGHPTIVIQKCLERTKQNIFCVVISTTAFSLKVVRRKQSGGPPKSLMCRENIGVNVKKNLWKVSSTPKTHLKYAEMLLVTRTGQNKQRRKNTYRGIANRSHTSFNLCERRGDWGVKTETHT